MVSNCILLFFGLVCCWGLKVCYMWFGLMI